MKWTVPYEVDINFVSGKQSDGYTEFNSAHGRPAFQSTLITI